MKQLATVVFLVSLVPKPAGGQDQPIEIPKVERKSYTLGGFLETRPAVVWLDAAAALYKLRWYGEATQVTTAQFNQQFVIDAAWQRGRWSVNSRSVLDVNRSDGDWSTHATSYEAYVSFKPSPSFTLDLGKKRQNWGKGYVWNPVAFVDRPKNPDDPTLAQEGFFIVSADYIKSFDGPLRTLSLTPVLLPVSEHVNQAYGRTGRLNAAGKLYVLLYDTDIDVLFLMGGSRPDRVGFDLSRNITSNLEIHGEVARIQDFVGKILGRDGWVSQAPRNTTSALVGLRYLTRSDTTFIVDYYHAGTGFAVDEMRNFFAFASTAYEKYVASGDATGLMQAVKAVESGYGSMSSMRNYLYVRAFQPDAWGVLYFTPAVYAIINTDDRSFSLTQEMVYKASGHLEVRSQVNVIAGARGTEFGEKQGSLRLELRVRYYF